MKTLEIELLGCTLLNRLMAKPQLNMLISGQKGYRSTSNDEERACGCCGCLETPTQLASLRRCPVGARRPHQNQKGLGTSKAWREAARMKARPYGRTVIEGTADAEPSAGLRRGG